MNNWGDKIDAFLNSLTKKSGGEWILVLLLTVIVVFVLVFLMWLVRKLWGLSRA